MIKAGRVTSWPFHLAVCRRRSPQAALHNVVPDPIYVAHTFIVKRLNWFVLPVRNVFLASLCKIRHGLSPCNAVVAQSVPGRYAGAVCKEQ